jgi:hypothetical protein
MLNVGDSKYWSKLTTGSSLPMSARLPPLSVGQLRQEKHRVWPDHSQKSGCSFSPRLLSGAADCRTENTMMMLSAPSRKNPVFLSGELPHVLGHYLASTPAGYDGGARKP